MVPIKPAPDRHDTIRLNVLLRKYMRLVQSVVPISRASDSKRRHARLVATEFDYYRCGPRAAGGSTHAKEWPRVNKPSERVDLGEAAAAGLQ